MKNRTRELVSNVMGISLLTYPSVQAGSVVVDTAANVRHQATVEMASNGLVPVVNIVKPDAQGISHNKFIDYNVNKEGLILNNSDKRDTYTQLSGYIYGNKNFLSGETAKLILNEVTSKNKTELRGFTEVAGDRAGVVVANPNGIYINGAGFINTSRSILTTGRPRFDADRLAGFGIEEGSIEIDGAGLNTTNVDEAELYAKVVKINAAINADALDIVTGSFDAGLNGDIVKHDTTEEKPEVSIDSSALGGIYANKIRLVGTEQGVGVNLPIEISAQESMTLGADGKIVLHKVLALSVEIHSSGSSVTSDIVYGDKVRIDAKEETLNHELLAAEASLDVRTGSLTNGDSATLGAGEVDIDADTLDNHGYLLSRNKMSLRADTLTNDAAIVALDSDADLVIEADTLTNTNTIYSGDSIGLYVGRTLTNGPGATIYAIGDIDIQGDRDRRSRTAQVTNDKGVIETAFGDLSIYVGNFDNITDPAVKETVQTGTSTIKLYPAGDSRFYDARTSGFRGGYEYSLSYLEQAKREVEGDVTPEKILARLNDYYGQYGLSVGYDDGFPGRYLGASPYYLDLARRGEERKRTYTAAFSEEILRSSPGRPAQLLSGGEMRIDARTRNYLGIISARGDIRLEGGIDNRGESFYRYSDVTGEYEYCYKECDSFLHNPDYTWADLNPIKTATLKETLASTIRSGGHITGAVESLANDAGVSENADFSTYTPGTSVSGASVETIARASENSLLPSGPYGLFVPVPPDKNLGYLVEANPLYTSYEHFTGSDYFLERMGYDSDRIAKRLGDAAYETRLVRDAVMSMTGERFLLPGADDDNDQFVRLMDSAVNVAGILGLEVGKPPSPEQLANLSEDIVWMEYKTINNEQVLVPVVYLAKDTQTAKGASIVADKGIALKVSGKALNSGSIVSGGDIMIDAGSITNNGGVVFAGGTASLVAKNDIANTNGGNISGAQTQVVSTEGSVINETYAQTFTEGGENHSVTYTLVGEQSVIQAREGGLAIEAAEDIKNIGSNMNASSSIALAAGGDVDFSARTLESAHTEIWGNGFDKARETGHLRSFADAGEHLLINAGGDITLTAARLVAKDTIALEAANITLASLNDIAYKDVQTYSKGSFGSSKTKHDMTYRETVTGSELDGADIVMKSTADMNLAGGSLLADRTIYADAGGDINIVAAKYREGELHYSKKKGFGGLSSSTSLDQSDSLNLQGSLLKTDAKNIVLQSGNDINVVASDARAEGVLAIKASGSVNILSDEETTSEEHYRRKTGISIGISDDMLSFSEDKRVSDAKEAVNQKSSLLSGAAIVVDAGRDITAIGSELAASSIDASAGGDVNLLSATETASHDHEESTKKAGIGVTLNINEASVFAGVMSKSDKLGGGQTQEVATQLLGDDITVRAGNNMNLLASNVLADHDAVIQAGKNINILSQDATSYKNEVHEELKAGIKVGVEQHLTDGVKQLADTGKALVDSDNPITAASSVLKSVDLITNTLTHSVSAGLDAFAETSKSETSAQSASAQNSVIYAGHDASLDAGKEILVTGSDIIAGNKVSLKAEEITLKSSAQNGSSSSSDQSGSLQATLFGTREGQIDASYAQSKNSSNDTVQRDAYVSGKEVAINTTGDTTLLGAHVSGDTVTANVGGNLSLISLQDTGSSKGDSENIALSTGMSASAGAGKSSGSKAWVNEQTGIIGAEKVDITVAGNTHLQGAIIANIDAQGNDLGNAHLATATLSTQDIYDHDTSSSSSLGIGNISAAQFQTDSRGTTGATFEGGYAYSDKQQINRATIGNGTITLTGGDALPDTLNRDISKAREITKDESKNYELYASQSSIDQVLDPAKTAVEWKQAAKDLGLSVHKEITENLPGSNAGGVAGVVGGALDTVGNLGILPSQSNSGGYITQVATQLFGDNRNVLMTLDESKFIALGMDKRKGDYSLQTIDGKETYVTNPNKTVRLTDNGASEGNLDDMKIYVDEAKAIELGLNGMFTNGIMNKALEAMINQMQQQGSPSIVLLNYNPTHGIAGDTLQMTQEKVAVMTNQDWLATGSSRQTGAIKTQLTKLNDGNLNTAAHSQGTMQDFLGTKLNKEEISQIVQNNPNAKFTTQYNGSPVSSDAAQELFSEIYGGEQALEKRTVNGINDVFKSSVNPGDLVAILGGNTAGINNQKNFWKNLGYDLTRGLPTLFNGGLEANLDNPDKTSSHSGYKCVIGCGDTGVTPKDVKKYFDPVTNLEVYLDGFYRMIHTEPSYSNVYIPQTNGETK